MGYHKRNLPHYYPPDAILFVTWRLAGSLPFGLKTADQPFGETDRRLDQAASGPKWLADRRIAAIVQEALKRGDEEYKLYELIAWVIMPNHIHIVIEIHQTLPKITRWLKGSTARNANLVLQKTGQPFWQDESYDRCVRTTDELNRIIRYVERNPVRAGLSQMIEEFPWSSATQAETPVPHHIPGVRPDLLP